MKKEKRGRENIPTTEKDFILQQDQKTSPIPEKKAELPLI